MFEYFKTNLTTPYVKDLVRGQSMQYNEIYDMLRNNTNFATSLQMQTAQPTSTALTALTASTASTALATNMDQTFSNAYTYNTNDYSDNTLQFMQPQQQQTLSSNFSMKEELKGFLRNEIQKNT